MLHESGTGGAPKYGIVPQMPLTSLQGVNLLDNLTYMQPRTVSDAASVGYYKISLANGVVAEMTASMHAGLMQYTFPKGGEKYILVDLSHYLPTQDEYVAEQAYSNGMLDVSKDGSMYSGYGIWRGGWNEGQDYTVFMCAKFDTTPSGFQLWRGPNSNEFLPNSIRDTATFVNGTSIVGGTTGYNFADRVGALFKFPAHATRIKSKVGVSWISVDKACAFLQEIPQYNMNATIEAAKSRWNTAVLSKIQINDKSNGTRLEMFYSAMYRAHLLPSNRTGENPNWVTKEPSYGMFCYKLRRVCKLCVAFLTLAWQMISIPRGTHSDV